jgi:tetratricopeptide (TPR) repeat protein
VIPRQGDITGGIAVDFDVVLVNEAVGHDFPGGTKDAQDTWVEVEVLDGSGRRLASSGLSYRQHGLEPGVHVLRTFVVGADAKPLRARQVAGFRTVVGDQTVPPRGARVARFSGAIDAEPEVVVVRVQHRSRALALQRAACAASKTATGKAFSAGAAASGRASVDPCPPQPVTTVAEARVPWSPAIRDWKRLYHHGIGLSHDVQENLDEARQSLDRALVFARGHGGRAEAAVLLALGKVHARSGRVDEALDTAAQVEALVPGQAATAWLRARALMGVWRWRDALPHLWTARRLAPSNVHVSTALARALLAVGDHGRAHGLAQQALRVWPRWSPFLLVQAVAARGLGLAEAPAAMDVYSRFRNSDHGSLLALRCSREIPGCRNWRLPVPRYELRKAENIP